MFHVKTLRKLYKRGGNGDTVCIYMTISKEQHIFNKLKLNELFSNN